MGRPQRHQRASRHAEHHRRPATRYSWSSNFIAFSPNEAARKFAPKVAGPWFGPWRAGLGFGPVECPAPLTGGWKTENLASACNEDYDGQYGPGATLATIVMCPGRGELHACEGGARRGTREVITL